VDGITDSARTVVVTGASRGFGSLMAAALAAAGWRVFATMRNPDDRAALDAAVTAARGEPADVSALALDVLDAGSIASAVSEVLERTGGRLDAVVANAGISVSGAFEDTPAEAMRRVMDTNYFGVVDTVRATLPALRVARGRIVLISSDSGLCGTPGLSGYTASKYAIEGFGESLAYEVAPLGVSLSIIEPGAFRTDIWSGEMHRSSAGPYAAFGEIAEKGLRAIGEQAPAPDPVAAAVVKALTVKRPRLRYRVGTDARRMAAYKRVLPDAAIRRIVRRATGVDGWRPRT
jgi:NAD(P)-dependent dehydrogenase (short-subunit alcohol dehydrogenase family)